MNDKQSEKRQILRELLVFSLGELLIAALMLGVYALLGKLDGRAVLGGGIGLLLAIVNYVLMALGVWAAADRAEGGDPAGGRRVITLSMLGRYLLIILVLYACAKSGRCDPIALVVPLALYRAVIYAGEFFRRKER